MPGFDDALAPFSCPRCARTVSERFWGPCRQCRSELVARFQAESSEADVSTRFEPAMHVVPNHVATKD